MIQANKPFVLTIDGPSGAGKGTISQKIASQHNWHYLDSGAIYRVSAYAIAQKGFDISESTDLPLIEAFVFDLDVAFLPDADGGVQVMLDGVDISEAIRTEAHGVYTSTLSSIPHLRSALLSWQQSMAKAPGLVADGRDMGTVVFPQADLKIFLTASAEIRAKRRFKQLKNKGISVNLSGLIEEIELRDHQDANRSVSPMKPAADAIEIDSTNLTIDEVVFNIEKHIKSHISKAVK